ncbi:hypothetical protein PoB_000449100 [Plakobranchus ocellatus]|uniref:Uncharacterized protein n=1 Tax=Plakobranchus ocellatus TaxID=259542 RepID=A0AAV3Y449_9GAST|nr:hypothetical protein PoB_000449100 [Plakobranchus ocellatus]
MYPSDLSNLAQSHWCFGLVKSLFRRTEVNCLDNIVRVIEKSSEGNKAHFCGNEKGEIFVKMFDWTLFHSNTFRKIKDNKKYHFQLTEGSSVVKMKEFSDSEEVLQTMLISQLPEHAMPESRAPKGLDLKRQWYLYDEMRICCRGRKFQRCCPHASLYETDCSKQNRSTGRCD